MVIGGGGREHAIILKLLENPAVQTIYALPGNAGIARDAECIPIAATALDDIVSFARAHRVDFAVVAPDDPLCMGLADRLEEIGVPTFGPSKAAARIEGSKSFAKNMMKRYGIPTASYEIFDDAHSALAYARVCPLPIVVKADGLALGKGVVIANTREQAQSAIRDMMIDGRFGQAGARIVIEEYLKGPEASLLLFTDGESYRLMPAAMDHKRALDGDNGENTGGMGAIAPNPFVTAELSRRIESDIIKPTLDAMRAEGCPFKGCMFIGLMLTEQGPKVIEYNCRFGDPEAQTVLPLLKSDLLSIMTAVRNGALADADVRFSSGAACCVVLASEGYPGAYKKGVPIYGYEKYVEAGAAQAAGRNPASFGAAGQRHALSDVRAYFAGVAKGGNGELVTSGGRVLGVTAAADTLENAIASAYAAVVDIQFEGRQMRTDIGARALCGAESSYNAGEANG
jgi:phosphoribosylamine--glycine ligase